MRDASSLSSLRFDAILHFRDGDLLFSSVSTSMSQAKSNKQTRQPFSFREAERERERKRNQTREQKDTDASLTMRTINVYSANNENACIMKWRTKEVQSFFCYRYFGTIRRNGGLEYSADGENLFIFYLLFLDFRCSKRTSNHSGRIRKFITIFSFDCQKRYSWLNDFRIDPSSRIFCLKNSWIRPSRTRMIY